MPMRNYERHILTLMMVFLPLIVMIYQQTTGFLNLRPNTPDSMLFSLLMVIVMSIGFSLQGKDSRKKIQFFLMGVIGLFAVPMMVSGFASLNDATYGTNFTEGKGVWFGLSTMGTEIAEWTLVINMVTGLIPAVVVVIGIVFIFLADTPDEYMVAIAETGLAVVIMIVASLGLGWLGIEVF